MRYSLLVAVLMVLSTGDVRAQQNHKDFVSPYEAPMKAMHDSMGAIPLTGDADRDFAALMITHHQGAIDMAKIEKASGRNPELTAMADAIIATQTQEIERLRRWLGEVVNASARSGGR